MTVHDLEIHPIHLGLGATATAEPPFSGMEWYAAYSARHASDGAEGRLVALHRFSQPWDAWEMHPKGAEVVLCIEGELTLIQEQAGGAELRTTLTAGQYAINAPGIWHTMDVAVPSAAIFITAGQGTEHRPR